MAESSGWVEFFKWLGQLTAVGLGWYVVHRLSAQRDRDKARREMLAKSADGLTDALLVILSDARDYHLKDRDRKLELKLKMSLQDLAMRVQGLSDICTDEKELAACRAAVAALRRAVTGLHFEDEHFNPLPDSDRQLEDIAEAVMRARRQLLRLKHLQFPAKAAL